MDQVGAKNLDPLVGQNPLTVYLIKPKLGGLAGVWTVQTEGGAVLFDVRSKILAIPGRAYYVCAPSGKKILTTRQKTTVLFPRHIVMQGERVVGELGQVGLIPQYYFLETPAMRVEIRMGAFDVVYRAMSREGRVVAEVAQHRSTWIVVVHATSDRFLILASLAILYRENTVGGA
jgi:hypothetical protein